MRTSSEGSMTKLKAHFDTFGFVVVRGALRDDIDWICEEHAAVFRDLGIEHDGGTRSAVVPFIDQRERLCGLVAHPAINGLLSELIGADFNYLAGDGNYYSGATHWHPDGAHTGLTFVKVALYLDPLTRQTGSLRVIPGSHRYLDWEARSAGKSRELWDIEGHEVPAVAVETQPGDIVCFNHNLMHSSWGGSDRRRMFTLNCSARARTPEEVAELREYISHHFTYDMERLHTDLMRRTAPMVHLEQGIANEDVLPPLVAQRRAANKPPSAATAGTSLGRS